VDSQGNELDVKRDANSVSPATTVSTTVATTVSTTTAAAAAIVDNKQSSTKSVVSKREGKEDREQVDLDDKISDAEFNESLKSLKRRGNAGMFATELETLSDGDEEVDQDRARRGGDDYLKDDLNDPSAETEQ
jgi:hypothetical protein